MVLTRNFLNEVTNVGTDDSNSIEFGNGKGRARIKISKQQNMGMNEGAEMDWTYWRVSPKGPTNSARESQITTTASLPHHSTCLAGPSAPITEEVSKSAISRWKSVDTTQRLRLKVISARDLPLGEGDTWVNGPRDTRWSTLSRLSTAWIVASTDSRTSTWRDIFKSGGMIAHACGGSCRPDEVKFWLSDNILE